MAKKELYAQGKIIKGDFRDGYIWNITSDEIIILPETRHHKFDPESSFTESNKKIVFDDGLFSFSEFGGLSLYRLLERMRENAQYVITSDNVDKIVDVASSSSGPSATAFVKGAVMGGAALGAAAAMASVGSSATLAVYMKDGKKFLVNFASISAAQGFKESLFKFDDFDSVNSQNIFETAEAAFEDDSGNAAQVERSGIRYIGTMKISLDDFARIEDKLHGEKTYDAVKLVQNKTVMSWREASYVVDNFDSLDFIKPYSILPVIRTVVPSKRNGLRMRMKSMKL